LPHLRASGAADAESCRVGSMRHTDLMEGADVVAAVAVAASAATAIYSLHAQGRRERERWLLEQRAAAYVALMEHLAAVRHFVASPDDDEKPVLAPETRARVNAFGTRPVIEAVGQMLQELGQLRTEEDDAPDGQQAGAAERTARKRRVIGAADHVTSQVRHELGASRDSGIAPRRRNLN